MSGCILDTDAAIAALDRRDLHHAKAATAIKAMSEEGVPLPHGIEGWA